MSDFSRFKYDYSRQAQKGPSVGPGPNNPYQPGGYRPGPQNNSQRSASRRLSDGVVAISWLVDIGLTFAVFPVGLFLSAANFFGFNFVGRLIQNIVDGSAGSRREQRDYTAAARYAYGNHNTAQNTAAAGTRGSTAQPAAAAAEKKKSDNSDMVANLITVLGIILLAFAVIAALGKALTTGLGMWALLTFVAAALGGGVMMLSGRKMKKKAARFRECMTVTKDQSIIKVEKLAKTLGMKDNEIYGFLAEMIDRGFFGEHAYIDHERGLLVVKPEDMRDIYRAEDEAKSAKAAREAQASETVYQKYIRQIAEADDAIADEEMSRKIRRMRELTEAIFREVEKNPAKKQKITRFMNYYLPTTLKLLDNYARIERQGVAGENMAKAKQDIERIADTLVEGYEKQLDTLFSSEAMDIASDVTVIEGLMRRDGLTGENDFRTQDDAFRQVVNEAQNAAPAARPAAQPAARPAAQVSRPAVQTSASAPSLRNNTPYVSPFGAASPLAGGAAAAVQEEKK